MPNVPEAPAHEKVASTGANQRTVAAGQIGSKRLARRAGVLTIVDVGTEQPRSNFQPVTKKVTVIHL